MNRLYAIPAALGLLTFSAAAQDDQKIAMEKMVAQVRVVGLQGGIMGKTIKNAPYSGVEVSESTQMLADGTRIHNESQTQVYRDSEGRMRRETPTEVTIWDPVANASYVLNPKTQTARKLPMGNFVYTTNRTVNGEMSTFTMRTDSTETIHATAAELSKRKAELEARLKAETGANHVVITGGPNVEVANKTVFRREKGTSESLGKKAIEGVSSEGTRTVSTIDAGAIGNDRPLQTLSERWFSPELQTVMHTRTVDPRNGEEVFKLINVNRAEPAGYLFQVPAGYQMIDAK
jgi:hypothetical protein